METYIDDWGQWEARSNNGRYLKCYCATCDLKGEIAGSQPIKTTRIPVNVHSERFNKYDVLEFCQL